MNDKPALSSFPIAANPDEPAVRSVREKNLEFHRLIASGLSKAEAKRRTGYNPRTVPRIHEDLLYELEKAGVTERRVAKKYREGLDARNKNGLPDMEVRATYLRMISEIKGYNMPARLNVSVGLNQYNLVADEDKVRRAIALIDAEMKAKELTRGQYLEPGKAASLEHGPIESGDTGTGTPAAIDAEIIPGTGTQAENNGHTDSAKGDIPGLHLPPDAQRA